MQLISYSRLDRSTSPAPDGAFVFSEAGMSSFPFHVLEVIVRAVGLSAVLTFFKLLILLFAGGAYGHVLSRHSLSTTKIKSEKCSISYGILRP